MLGKVYKKKEVNFIVNLMLYFDKIWTYNMIVVFECCYRKWEFLKKSVSLMHNIHNGDFFSFV